MYFSIDLAQATILPPHETATESKITFVNTKNQNKNAKRIHI